LRFTTNKKKSLMNLKTLLYLLGFRKKSADQHLTDTEDALRIEVLPSSIAANHQLPAIVKIAESADVKKVPSRGVASIQSRLDGKPAKKARFTTSSGKYRTAYVVGHESGQVVLSRHRRSSRFVRAVAG